MDVRSPLFQNVAAVLVGVMFLNPIVGAAADLTAAAGSGATVDQARNGVPVVNIAAPNGSGLSHNKFRDYNVGQKGLILNNATNSTQATQLGGIILGNPNLKGRAAGLILNEVTGGNASRLQGYTEVAGKSAHVVVANPHGITCDGCGFINTPRVTLSTGTPMIENGRLDRFDVNGGSIAIEGLGLNASNVDQFDLITRSAKINAELHANKLNIITGRNEVKASDLSVTAKTPDGSDKPLLAIDSSALGGMYAGAIRLVGTEAGVGVKLAGDMAASAGDIQIDANGQLSIGRAAAARDITLKAQNIELEQATYAARDASVDAENLTNQVSLATGGDLTITARQVVNAQDAILEAGIRADGSANAAATLTVTGERLDNAGDIVAHGALNTDLESLSNRATVLATGKASINADTLVNQGGTLIGQQALKITGDQLNNRAGTLASNGALDVILSGDLDNRDEGILLSKGGDLNVAAQTLNNQNGNVQADNGALTVTAATLNNTAGNIGAAQGALNLDAATTHNQGGNLQGSTVTLIGQTLNNGGSVIASTGQAQLTVDTLNNANGTLLAATDLSVTAIDLSNDSGKVGANAVDLNLSGKLNNNNGLIESATTLGVTAEQASNIKGKLRALGNSSHSQFSLGRLFDNTSGLVEIGNAAFTLGVPSLKNQAGTVRHLGTAGFNIGMDNLGSAGGSFMTNSALAFNADEWTNTSQIQAGRLDLDIKRLTQTNTGALLAIESLNLAGTRWINDGRIETDGSLELTLAGNYSGNGALLAQDDLVLKAANISVGQNGELRSGGFGTFTAAQAFDNTGVVTSTTGLELNAASMLNQGTLGSAEGVRIVTPSLSNVGGLIFSGANMDLFANQLTNREADIYSLGNLLVAANSDGDKASRFSNLSGTVESAGWMSVAASLLENARETFEISSRKISARLVYTGCGDCGGSKESSHFRLEEIDVTQATNVSSQAQLLAGQDMTLRSDTLDNRYSLIASGANIQIDTDVLRNQGAQAGKITTTRNLSAHRVYQSKVQERRVEADDFTDRNWIGSSSYNPGDITRDVNSFISRHVYRVGNPDTALSDFVDFGATIQGAGKVTIKARERFDNSVIRPSFAYVSGGNRVANTQPGSSIATTVTFNPQLPPDLAQQVVDPLTLPGFSLPQGQNGMFHFNPSGSHNYLIETNPAFASLKNFLSSDYMLGLLGYDTDATQKRLGDGFYEQRLIREAIVDRTGQRYLANLTSDEAMFRYLMDNAIASKDALGLSLGVSLTAEQVAALTHDIVWMEEREVMGEKVLVPMLYLAQAEGRLAPAGALIQGQDVALIGGSSLNNQGTLRASQNLDVTAGNITNSGLMQANERQQLQAL
nr:filamentous hemagglutinin N-terminal domain-containing protein [Pseudomonas sp.]